MIAVNTLIQEAFELVSMTGDGEAVEGTYAAKGLKCLNRVISELNNDNYFSASQAFSEVTASGEITFKKLEAGEAPQPGTIDMEPPESVAGVSRKVGIRWLILLPSNPVQMMSVQSYSLAAMYSYALTSEVAPSGETRMVGKVILNGTASSTFRVFYNAYLPVYKMTDSIAVSPLYHDAILFSLAAELCVEYKLDDYKPDMLRRKSAALSIIDRNTLNNRAMNSGTIAGGSYMDPYYNGLGGNGFVL